MLELYRRNLRSLLGNREEMIELKVQSSIIFIYKSYQLHLNKLWIYAILRNSEDFQNIFLFPNVDTC